MAGIGSFPTTSAAAGVRAAATATARVRSTAARAARSAAATVRTATATTSADSKEVSRHDGLVLATAVADTVGRTTAWGSAKAVTIWATDTGCGGCAATTGGSIELMILCPCEEECNVTSSSTATADNAAAASATFPKGAIIAL